ncbi:hypothetical protein PF005_g10091 [Phytophthora fragariae]|uniref:Uncharacterized protein n=1 Tax=Phytophthora fragariae TaxID=53985 RepID=A0A6A3Y7V2_9STRA|nr:hypothetical protein PF005_g10091 [Phytophthora fragariae]
MQPPAAGGAGGERRAAAEKIPEKIVAGSGPIPKLVVGDSSPEKLVVVGNSPETLGPRLRRQSTSCGREEHLSTQLQLAGALARPGKLAAAAAYSLRLEAGSGLSSWAVFMYRGCPKPGATKQRFSHFFFSLFRHSCITEPENPRFRHKSGILFRSRAV